MISFLFASAGLLNLLFYIFAIGFVISLLLEQWLKVRPLSVDSSMNERNMYIVQSNRKYCWRQAWITNVYWFLCNVGLYFVSRSMGHTFGHILERHMKRKLVSIGVVLTFIWGILIGLPSIASANHLPVMYVQVPQWADDWAVCAVDIPDAKCHWYVMSPDNTFGEGFDWEEAPWFDANGLNDIAPMQAKTVVEKLQEK